VSVVVGLLHWLLADHAGSNQNITSPLVIAIDIVLKRITDVFCVLKCFVVKSGLTDNSPEQCCKGLWTGRRGDDRNRFREGNHPHLWRRCREPETRPRRKKPLLQMTSRLFEEKRLARLLHQVIKDGETLLLNGGSATRCCAEELGSRDLKIVTNNLDISFDWVTGAHVYVLGGRCLRDARVTVGPMIVSGMNIPVDAAVIGVDGITVKEGLSNNNPEEALMTSEMIAAARRTIVVADSSKFANKSFARIGPLASMQVLITDKEPPADLAHALDEGRVEVLIAPQEVVGSARLRNRFTNLSNGVEPAYSLSVPPPDNVTATTTKPYSLTGHNGTTNRVGLDFAAP
jgi:DeoR family transcriptional regulator, fructose operon transcriptional repressor